MNRQINTAVRTYPFGSLESYDYVVMLSRYDGKYLLSRHKGRTTWELQGGHIEHGESPDKAAKRELYEESGADSFDIRPLCDYCGEEPGRNNFGRGKVYTVEIKHISNLPESEMAEIRLFDTVPDELTYPEITHAILSYKR
ncbi:MAG: NUDIX domain-containing protein [Anaerolineaceae bacterium]|nr:NUDIX domain-containing protein [Anaerolineaceae bacterium]